MDKIIGMCIYLYLDEKESCGLHPSKDPLLVVIPANGQILQEHQTEIYCSICCNLIFLFIGRIRAIDLL